MKKLSILLDKRYDFEISFYRRPDNASIFSLITRPDNYFMLLKRKVPGDIWQLVRSSASHPEFAVALLKLAPVLMTCLLAVCPVLPAELLDATYPALEG
jgi:hypothetical protein